MKKISLLFLMLLLSGKMMASTFDCANSPTQQYTVSGTTYTCGYTNVPAASGNNRNDAACYYVNSGGTYPNSNGSPTVITNCASAVLAPINSGLIFLLIAGAGLGLFVIVRQNSRAFTNIV